MSVGENGTDAKDGRCDGERDRDEDDGIDRLAARRRRDVAEPELLRAGVVSNPVKDDHVPVLADEIGQQAPEDYVRRRTECRLERTGIDARGAAGAAIVDQTSARTMKFRTKPTLTTIWAARRPYSSV